MVFRAVYPGMFSARYSAFRQYAEAVALSGLGFLIPFAVGHPQVVVGVLVNAFIIRAALTLPRWRALPVVFTPALGALARGMVFGPYTLFLAVMVPFIWAGNILLMESFRSRLLGKPGFFANLALAAGGKALLLGASAYMLFVAGLLPEALVAPMGLLQFGTAVGGGLVAYGALKAEGYLGRGVDG